MKHGPEHEAAATSDVADRQRLGQGLGMVFGQGLGHEFRAPSWAPFWSHFQLIVRITTALFL